MNQIETRNLLIEQLANALKLGLCNKSIMELANRLACQCLLVDWQLRSMIKDAESSGHVTESTMKKLLLEPHL